MTDPGVTLSAHRAPVILLRADQEVVPFRSRETELSSHVAWCRDPQSVLEIRLVRGPGGQGKTPLSMFVADLDLTSSRLADGRPAGGQLIAALHRAGFSYDPRRHRVTRTGPGDVDLPYRYLGADDRAGPNYTGQPAVNSIYAEQKMADRPRWRPVATGRPRAQRRSRGWTIVNMAM
jgi:hypothetical protein